MDTNAPHLRAAAAAPAKKNLAFAKLAFRKSTAAEALAAEADPINPWTRVPRERSKEYFSHLEMRRGLPVANSREAFIEAYIKEQVIVYVGETGSGKTTQIPQYIMYADLPDDGGKKIVCTQPRRLAAREVSKRVAEELDVQLGEEVGYAFRNEAQLGPRTRVIYTTDGRLVQEIGGDPNLDKYSCIMIDDAHERSETTDLLLGLLRPILQRRRDLKLIIMSATMRVDTFQKYFDQCRTFNTAGRTYGYELYYAGWGDGMESSVDYVVSAVKTVKYILQKRVGEDPHSKTNGMGDILIFVPGEDDIKRTIAGVRYEFPHHTVVGLHDNMGKAEQEEALAPATGVKVIVATNIAETSLTIEGIVHVIDTGLTKGMYYNPRLNLWTLAVEPISQAAADQRAGRCGRTRPGFCWRLYSEESYNKILIKDPPPQLLRGDMMGMLLDLTALGRTASSTSVRDFPFLDKPAPEVLLRSWYALQNLGCIDGHGQITADGRLARKLPVDPYSGMAIIRARNLAPTRPVWEIMAIVSLLVEDGVFIRPGHLASYADIVRERWSSPHGDHFTLLNVWHAFQWQLRVCRDHTEDARDEHLAGWCAVHYLNYAKLLSAKATFENIGRWMFKEMKMDATPAPPSVQGSPRYVEVIKRILLQAWFLHIAVKDPRDKSGQTYRTLEDNQPGIVHPASTVSRGYKYDFIIYDKFLDQGKPYFVDATGVSSDWLFEDPVTAPYVEKLLVTDRLPRSENFVSLNRLAVARSLYQKRASSSKE